MPSLASGNCCWTACASTWAALWRMTARPSSVSAGTGSTSTSSSGRHARSLRVPSGARTTTTVCGPVPERPASRTASPAVVPAPTRTVAAGAGAASEDTAVLLGREGVVGRGCAPRVPAYRPAARGFVRSSRADLEGRAGGTAAERGDEERLHGPHHGQGPRGGQQVEPVLGVRELGVRDRARRGRAQRPDEGA